jgi:hypothetical protein
MCEYWLAKARERAPTPPPVVRKRANWGAHGAGARSGATPAAASALYIESTDIVWGKERGRRRKRQSCVKHERRARAEWPAGCAADDERTSAFCPRFDFFEIFQFLDESNLEKQKETFFCAMAKVSTKSAPSMDRAHLSQPSSPLEYFSPCY